MTVEAWSEIRSSEMRGIRHVLRAGAGYVSKGAQWMDSLVPLQPRSPMNSRAGVLMWSRRYPASPTSSAESSRHKIVFPAALELDQTCD